MRILKEPLFHFLLLGLAIFAWHAYLDPADPGGNDDAEITISTAKIERLIQQFTTSWRRPPTMDELQSLTDSLVREEVLVREARTLGLDQGDSVIRGRLRQKMEFLTTSVAQAMQPSEKALEAHLSENPDPFRRPALLAFQQVVLSGEDERATRNMLEALANGADPATFGKPSLLPPELPLSDRNNVDAIFGTGFFDRLDALPPGEWAGPVRSGYGGHLVRVTQSSAPNLPPLEDIRDRVLLDWRRKTASDLSEAQFQALKDRYRVSLPDLSPFAGRLSE